MYLFIVRRVTCNTVSVVGFEMTQARAFVSKQHILCILPVSFLQSPFHCLSLLADYSAADCFLTSISRHSPIPRYESCLCSFFCFSSFPLLFKFIKTSSWFRRRFILLFSLVYPSSSLVSSFISSFTQVVSFFAVRCCVTLSLFSDQSLRCVPCLTAFSSLPVGFYIILPFPQPVFHIMNTALVRACKHSQLSLFFAFSNVPRFPSFLSAFFWFLIIMAFRATT